MKLVLGCCIVACEAGPLMRRRCCMREMAPVGGIVPWRGGIKNK